MKKKIISIMLAAAMLVSMTSALAESKTGRAVLMRYDARGVLVGSKLLKADENGSFNISPSDYEGTTNKIYYVDTQELKDLDTVSETAPTEAPAVTAAPAATEAPAATVKPTATPKASGDRSMEGTPYDKEVDELYSPALITDIGKSINSEGEEVYRVTTYYLGREVTVDIDTDIRIRTAPEAYSYMKGKDAGSLQKGDVVWMTSNIAGDYIRTIDFITRPTEEDIVTGKADYGTSFEKLFTDNGSVADTFTYLQYGAGSTSAATKYEYAYGIVATMKGSRLTLLNTSGVTDDALSIGVNNKAYVYTCDVSGKDYEFTLGDINDIAPSISSKEMNKEVADLNADNTYSYALVRLVEGKAAEIIQFINYND